MLAIRLQRLGRKSLPIYRLAVQEAQRHPSSGRVVSYVGSYNPHTKETHLNLEKLELYLGNGAQPTPRVVRILKDQKVKLPSWVKIPADKKRDIKHSEKLRRNQPAEEVVEEAPAEPVVEAPAENSEEA
jgi:small subunit ribosomal protein S16